MYYIIFALNPLIPKTNIAMQHVVCQFYHVTSEHKVLDNKEASDFYPWEKGLEIFDSLFKVLKINHLHIKVFMINLSYINGHMHRRNVWSVTFSERLAGINALGCGCQP